MPAEAGGLGGDALAVALLVEPFAQSEAVIDGVRLILWSGHPDNGS